MLVNKCDTVTAEQVEQVIAAVRELAPQAHILRTQFAEFPLQVLDSIRRPQVTVVGAPGEGRPDPVFSHTVRAQGHFDRAGWERFVAALGPGLMRLKGFISLEGERTYAEATMGWASLSSTGKPADGSNEVVVIGQGLSRKEVESLFFAELHPSEE